VKYIYALLIFLVLVLFSSSMVIAQHFTSVTIIEKTGYFGSATFYANDSRLYTSLGYYLSSSRSDYSTSATEYYDIYFSDADGNLAELSPGDPLPENVFITIVCWDGTGTTPDVAPNWRGSGNNLESITMRFSDGTVWYAQAITNVVWGNCDVPPPNTEYPVENILGPPDNLIIGMGGGHSEITVMMGPEPSSDVGKITILDAAPCFMGGVDVTQAVPDFESICTGGEVRCGTVADGTSRLLIRYEAPGDGTVRVQLVDNEGLNRPLGRMRAISSSASDLEAEMHTVTTSQGEQAYFIYTPPDKFCDDCSYYSRSVKLRVSFVPDTEGESVELSKLILIKRPPVLFVHGLNGSPYSWTAFINQSSSDIYFVDFRVKLFDKMDKLDVQMWGFKQKLLKLILFRYYKYIIGRQHNSKFACAQINVVCHSMGGLTVRNWLKDDEIINNENTFSDEGIVNSVITIATPHLGTPISDEVKKRRSDSSWIMGIKDLAGIFYDLLPQEMIEETCMFSDAIKELGRTDVRCHVIGGAYSEINPDDSWTSYSNRSESILNILSVLDFFGKYPSPHELFGESPHDGFVPLSSAYGGLSDQHTTLYTEKDNGTHWTIIRSNTVVQKVFEFLDRGAESDYFAEYFPDPSSLQMYASSDNKGEMRVLPLQASTDNCIEISSPMDGDVVTSGSSIPITVDTYGESTLWIGIISDWASANIDPDNSQGELEIPIDASGEFYITAIALMEDSTLCISNPINLYAVPNAVVEEFKVTPRDVVLEMPGDERQLVVAGRYSDGIWRSANSSVVGTRYKVSDPDVIDVKEDGTIIAKEVGVTTLLVINDSDGQRELVNVVVESGHNSPPVADAGGPYSVCVGQELCLDATGSTDSDVESIDELGFLWDIDGDGQFNDAFGPTPCFNATQVDDRMVYLLVFDEHGSSSVDSAKVTVVTCDCEQPVLSLTGYKSCSWEEPIWRVQVMVRNNGPGVAKNVTVRMNSDLTWLTIPDPVCYYGDIIEDSTSCGTSADMYTFDLSNYPGGSFNVWFDVTYEDECGNKYHVRLDPEFNLNESSSENEVPVASYRLDQNYPNPFNPTTNIYYQIPTAGIVDLKVYDVSGRLVRTLINGFKEKGLYSVSWDGKDEFGRDVASGVYFLRMRAGDFDKTRRMILLR